MTFDGTIWTYTLDNDNADVQALGVGDTLTEDFTFTATDSQSLTVTITINGANDAPTLDAAGVATRSVTVGEAVTDITQTYLLGLFNDIDGDALTLMVTGLPSGLSYNPTDGITGTPTASGIITVTIEADDGNGGTVEKTLEITVGQIVNADTSDPVTGTLGLSNPVLPSNPIGQYGTITLASGTWTYTLNTATTQALKAGEEVTETFTFTNTGDQETEIVIITVVGVNDAPVVDTAIDPQRVTVDLPITAIDLSDLFSDVDGDTLTLTVRGLPSGLSYARDTGITGTPDAVGTFTVTVVADDGNGGTVESTFDIVVSAQAVSGDDAGAVTEDGTPVTGMLEVAGATGTPPTIALTNGTGQYGTMTFDGTTWTYTLDNASAAVQALAEGEIKTETFTFTAAGSEPLTVTITVTGANDAPVITASGGVSVEDGDTALRADVLTIEDDNGDTAAYTSSSFTITAGTGATAAIANKFEMVQDTNGRWQLALKSLQSFVLADAATFVINVSVTDAGGLSADVDVTFTVTPVLNVDTGNSDIVGTADEGDPSVVNGDLDVNDDTLLASTTPFSISTDGTYGTATIDDNGTWEYKLNNGHPDVMALNSGDDPLTDTFVVDVNPASGSAKTQTITITISGKTNMVGSSGADTLDQSASTDDLIILGGNQADTLIGGSGDDLLVGGYGEDTIDLSAGGIDTVVYRINSSDANSLVKAEDGQDTVMEFTPGEDKLVILDVNGSPVTLAGFFTALATDRFQLGSEGDTDGTGDLSDSELDAGARAFIDIVFQSGGTVDGGPTSGGAGGQIRIFFDRVTSEALNDMSTWDTLTGGTNFTASTINTAALLSSLFGGFGRPGYDAALDDGDFISIIGSGDLPDSYFDIA